MVIDVDNTDTSVPSGTYASIGNALNEGKNVFVRVNYEVGQDVQYKLLPLVLKYDIPGDEESYYFSCQEDTRNLTVGIYSNDFLSIEFKGFALSEHTHGNITRDGKLTTDITIANGDKLVVTDASNSNRVARASLTFDGSTTTQALSKKGTWEVFGEKTWLYMSVSGDTPSFTDANNNSLTHAQVIALLQDNTKDVVIFTSSNSLFICNYADPGNTYYFDSVHPDEHRAESFSLDVAQNNSLIYTLNDDGYLVTNTEKTTWNNKADKLKNIVIVKSGTSPNYTYSLPSGVTAASIATDITTNGTTVVCTLDGETYYYDHTTGSSTSSVLHFKYVDTTTDGVVEKDLAIAYSNNAVTLTTTTADLSSKVSKVTSTDNAIARYDGTGGQIQNSGVTIDDSNNVSTAGNVKAKDIIVHGSVTSNDTRIITSDSTNNIYAKIGTTIPFVANDTEVRSGSSVAGTINLGTSTVPWNNVYAKKFITKDGTSSQVVLGDGSLKAANELSQYEAYLQWGGKNFVGEYGVADACMIPNLGSNKFAYGNPSGVTVEYSRDGGTTWQDYGLTDSQKRGLFVNAHTLNIGKADTNNPATTDYKLRIIIHTKAFGLYTVLNKFAFYVTNTTGNNHSFVTIDGRTQSDKEADNDVWTTFVDSQNINGWSGWNIVNYPSGITTHGNRLVQYGDLRFTFFITATPSGTTSSGLTIIKMMGYGGEGWTTPSNMAATGHLYAHDDEQNATFPANITATKFITKNGTSSQFVKGDGTLDSTSTAANSLLSSLPDWTAVPTDTTKLVRRDTSGSASFGQVTFLTVWNYIKSKISSVLGIGGDNGVPTAPTAASGTNTTQIATTAFVQAAVSDKADKCLVVTITRSGTSPNYTYTANKTYTEIGNALTAGTTVVLSYNSVYYWFTAKGNGNTPDLIFSNTSVDLGDTIEVAGKFFTITTSSVTYWENLLTDTQQTLIYMDIDEEAKSGSTCYFSDVSGNDLTHAQVSALIEDTTKDIVIIHTPNEDSGQAYFRQNGYFANIKGGTKSLSNGAKAYFTGFAQGDSKWYNITLTWNNNAFTAECVAISGGSGSGISFYYVDKTSLPWVFYDINNNIVDHSTILAALYENPASLVFATDTDLGERVVLRYNSNDFGLGSYTGSSPYEPTMVSIIEFGDRNDTLTCDYSEYTFAQSRSLTVTINGTIASPSFAANPYQNVYELAHYGNLPVLNANINPLSMTGVQIPVYSYTYQVSGTNYTGYKGFIQKGNYEIAVDLKDSGSTVTITSVGSSITVDTALSESSTNPVQNRVITAQILENEEIVATALNNLNDRVELKQDQLVSGTTIKTINNQSILGSGNISISGGGGGGGEENVIEVVKVNGTALTPDANKAVNITSVPSSIVTQDATHRFVSDTEKTTWNGKQNALQYYSESGSDARINVPTDNIGEGSGSHGTITLACRDEMTDQAIAMSEISMDNVSLHHEEYDSSTGTTSLSQDIYIGNNGIKLNYDTIDNQGHEVVLSTSGFTYDNKQIATTDQIPSAVTESTVSGWGFTKNAGTITGITMNGSSKGTSGVVNLGTVVTSETDPVFTASAAHGITAQDIANWNAKQNSLANTQNPYTAQGTSTKVPTITTNNLGQVTTITETDIAFPTLSKGTTSGSGNAVTDISVSGHTITLTKGSTFGTYSKPSGGIPSTDLATAVSQRLLPEGSGSTDDGKILQYSYTGGGWQLVKPITIYTGSSAPSSSTGSNGDIYIQTS